jgi:hypothetical protein
MTFLAFDKRIIRLSEDFRHRWNVRLFYLGLWCIFRRQQLLDFQKNSSDFKKKEKMLVQC